MSAPYGWTGEDRTAGRIDPGRALREAGSHAGDDSGIVEALDAAYRAEDRRWVDPVTHITARATTLRVGPT